MAHYIPKETRGGVEITEKEIELIKELHKLERKWKKYGERLWLYSASGNLCVMMYGGDSNPNPTMREDEGVNPDNYITSINIPNDGGDW